MGLVQEPKLTTEYVLRRVDEATIFSTYFGPFKFRQTYSSKLRTDRNPSCSFYINKSGKLVLHDLSTGEKFDCFAFVAALYSLEYGAAVRKVAADFGVIDVAGAKPLAPTEIVKAELNTEDIKKETVIEIIPDKWTDEALRYWAELYITEDELKENDVYLPRKLFINGKHIPNYKKELRFAYVVEANGMSYKKIYTPFAEKRQFKWISNIPLHIPFGINKLPFKSNRLIITKSQKDRMLFKKFFTDVIGSQNESPSAIGEKTRNWISKRYDHVIMNQDLDNAGIASCDYFAQFGYEPLFVPDIVKEKHGIKDFADMVKHYGLKKFEDYLKHINLL